MADGIFTSLKVVPFIKKVFPAGARYGLFFYFLSFVVSLLWNAGFSVMGIQNNEASAFIIAQFWPFILFAQIKILLVYLGIGYSLGMAAEFTARYFPFKIVGSRAAMLLLFTAYFFLKSIKVYPQLYAESLWYKDDFLKIFQVFVTDYLPIGFFLFLQILMMCIIGIAMGRWLLQRAKQRAFLLSLVFIAGASFVFGKSLTRVQVPRSQGPHILILAADSLRYDYVYGRRDIAPHINTLMDEGVVFYAHHSSVPRTFPAMVSLFTGKLPFNHGLRHMFPDKWNRDFRESSFVEKLRKEGYATAAVGDFAGDVFSRMDIGFEDVRAPYFNFITLINQRSLEIHFLLMPYLTNRFARSIFPELKEFANHADPFLLSGELEEKLDCLRNDESFFCFAFYSTAHFPYASPYPYYRKYALPRYARRYKYHKPPTIYEKESMLPEDVEQVHALYKGSVNAIDDAIGRIIAYLKKNGLYDNTIIIITADHGENLYENDWSTGHGEHLRGPHVVKIPLIIKFPNGEYAGTKVHAITRDIDLMPTVFDYLKHIPLETIDGASILPVIQGRKSTLNLTAYSETGIWFSDVTDGFYQQQRLSYPDITGLSEIDFSYNLEVVIKDKYKELVNAAKHRMIDDGALRLIYMPTPHGVRYELYDSSYPDGLKKDIAAQKPQELARMKRMFFEFTKNDKALIYR